MVLVNGFFGADIETTCIPRDQDAWLAQDVEFAKGLTAEDILQRLSSRSFKACLKELGSALGVPPLVFRERCGARDVLAQPAELVASGLEVSAWLEEKGKQWVDTFGTADQ